VNRFFQFLLSPSARNRGNLPATHEYCSNSVPVSFRVTPKVFATCFWGTCCMLSHHMVQDGIVHWRWSVLDLHSGDILLSGFLTSSGCLLGILP